jgi:small-conductance mechanosensitive channel
VTLGCLVAGLNIAWTRIVISRALRGERTKARVLIAYFAKFGLTVLLLFLAIVRFGIDPLGILVGVSALLVAVTVVVIARYAF